MRPFLRHGQRLLVEKKLAAAMRPGDIAVFRSPADRVLVHRVRRVWTGPEGLKLLLRGDNVGHNDGINDYAEVLGVVWARMQGGVAVKFTRIELSAGLLLAPLFFRVRELLIFALAFCVRFMYSFMGIKKARYSGVNGDFCLVYSWRGWPVCKRRSHGRTWVHPVFARTSILSEIMQEQQ